MKINFDINSLKFSHNGLIPAIVQDHTTKQVLMMAYMNKESIQISIDEKKTCFYSRSRKELWRKGATSGNYQHIVNISADCDLDTLLIEVEKDGPACHTGKESCFFNEVFNNENLSQDIASDKFNLEVLYNLILDRKKQPKEGSYTSYLFEKGIDKILKKVGEESTEVVIAAKNNDKKETVFEVADVLYHLMVLMGEMNISVDDIMNELEGRHVVDHKVKQEYMK